MAPTRSTRSLLAAALAIAALVPPIAAVPSPAAASAIEGGELTWGLRQSFREYVGVGNIHPSGGAAMDAAGVLTFPVVEGDYDPDTTTTDVRFGGEVRYATYCGHGGRPADECTLDLTISQLRLVLSRDEQVLYGRVQSRPLTLGADIVDYGVIPVATLDIGPSSVAVEGGATAWSGITAAVADDFSPAITYATGAPLDPLALRYTGDGGKPDLSEHWSAPGTIALEESARWTQVGDVTGLHIDDANGVLHVVRAPTATQGAHIQALDSTTLEPLGDSGTLGRGGSPSNYSGAFDPVTGTVFTALTATDRTTAPPTTVTTVHALTWDADAETYTRDTVGRVPAGANLQTNIVWDGGALFALTFRSGEPASVLQRWQPGDSGWQHASLPLPAGEGATPTSWYRPGDTNYGFAALRPGLLVIARQFVSDPTGELLLDRPSALAVSVHADSADVAPIPGTGSDEWVPAADGVTAWSRVSASTDGRFALHESGGAGDQAAILFGSAGDPGVTVEAEPVAFGIPNGAVLTGEFDPVDGTYWAKARNAGLLYPVVDGAVGEPIAHPDSFYFAGLAVGDDHTLYSALRDPARVQGVARLPRVGVSPAVGTQPIDARVQVAGPDDRVPVTFQAAATGSPVPTVQWQARAAGAVRFSDLDGATDPTLTVQVGAAENGTEYRAVFTNPAGAIASDGASVTVLSPPTIALQPASTSVGAGGSAQFLVMPGGNPEPTVTWQRFADGRWVDVTADEQFAPEGGYLTIRHVRADQDGSRFRAALSNVAGTAVSEEVVLTVTADPVVPVPQEDGSIIGVKNAAGAHTQVKPGIEVPLAEDGAALRVSGFGFTKNTNEAGIYALFGYLVTPPSAGGSAGNGYDFLPGGGDSGQVGQLFISWPGNDETGSGANGTFTSAERGEFTADGLIARAQFTGQSGATVNCLDGTVVCGVLTIGAHGGADAHLETFTPIYFVGQEIPEGPVTPPKPPTTPPPTPQPPAVATEEGSLTWGVKASFRNYIVTTARGSITLAGASLASGAFRFGQASGAWDAGTGTGAADYGGSVRFTGHGGILDLTLSDPGIRVDSPGSGTLFVTVNGSRVAIGTVDLASASRRDLPGGVAYGGAPVSLTAAGASVFSYGSSQFYRAGTAMDPVSFVIGAAASSFGGGGTVAAFEPSAWTPPAEPPATEGIEGDPEELAEVHAGGELTVWADGFQPNEQNIKVVIYSEPIVLDEHLTADATGRATWTGIIPADLEPGEHTLTFQGSVNRGIVLEVGAPRSPQGCLVEDATLDWGFKETFRAYISGSIAHGEWAVQDGATYETPEFGWPAGTGTFDPESFSGLIRFAGGVRFTGHDGLLDTTIANPQLRIVDERTAFLLLDVSGPTMEAALNGTGETVDERGVPFVRLDLAAGDVTVSADGTITATAVPTAITSEGYATFPNYEAGTAFDPISFTIAPSEDCAVEAVADEQPTGTASAPGPDLAWLWWVGAGMLVLAALVLVLLWRQRRRAAA